jgi:hypothetical protein
MPHTPRSGIGLGREHVGRLPGAHSTTRLPFALKARLAPRRSRDTTEYPLPPACHASGRGALSRDELRTRVVGSSLVSSACVRPCSAAYGSVLRPRSRTWAGRGELASRALKIGRSTVRPRPWPPPLTSLDPGFLDLTHSASSQFSAQLRPSPDLERLQQVCLGWRGMCGCAPGLNRWVGRESREQR